MLFSIKSFNASSPYHQPGFDTYKLKRKKLEKMKKKQIYIPENIYHLSDYQGLQTHFPQGSFILDKTITGCGATTMFLSDKIPTILCSPRLELMHCKANSPEFIGLVHEFRKFGDTRPVLTLENELMDYVNDHSPFCSPYPPKILVSYDSFKHVAQVLAKKLKLAMFRIVVDEAQTLFTDASFKGDVEIEFLENLKQNNQVIFLSATPYMENYLDQMDDFKNLPYVELVWPPSSTNPTNIEKLPYYQNSPQKTATHIIQGFRDKGYFKDKMYDGQVMYSNEAVFFINDVGSIIGIIKANQLTPDNTNVICAENDDNSKRLKKIGFEIGHAPKMGGPHKTFTFVTKCAFEGVDFYSPCAYTYIFSNINLENLALDISLDLPQIMGRQRRSDNLFRYDATFYYKELMDYSDERHKEFENRIIEKQKLSDGLIDTYNNCNQENVKQLLADKYRTSQKFDKFSKDYVAVIDDEVNGTQRVVFNQLAMFNEIRAWDIQKSQYIDGCQVMRSVDDATFSITEDKELESFLLAFDGTFEKMMKMYCDFLQQHPDYKAKLEWLPQIPLEIKTYYNAIGPDNLRSLSYKEADIKRFMGYIDLHDSIKATAESMFVKGLFYTLKQTKEMLQLIYDNLGAAMKAKATDLKELLDCAATKQTVDGRRENGYLIL